MIYASLPEREAAVIRGAVDGLVQWEADQSQMTIRFRSGGATVVIPQNEVVAYVETWRRSGLWALRGVGADT